MTANEIKTVVDGLSEALVFADPGDLPALAEIHTKVTEVGQWAVGEGLETTGLAADRLGDLIEKIILGEVDEVSAAWTTVNSTIGVFQRLVEGGGDSGKIEMEYPAELGLVAEEEGGQFKVSLPAYVDEAIFADFLARQDGVLDEMENLILELEKGGSKSSIDALKRHMHTLKGESALLGLAEIEKLCHAAEDRIVGDAPQGIGDALLGLRDWLKQVFDAYSGKGSMPAFPQDLFEAFTGGAAVSEAASEEVVAASAIEEEAAPVAAEAAQPPEPVPAPAPAAVDMPQFEAKPLEGDQELIGDFIVEATEHLDNCDVHLLTLETDPSEEDAVNAVFRAFHTIKGVAGFLALDEVQALAHEAENLLDLSRKGSIVLQGPTIDAVFDAVDVLKLCIANINNALSSGGDLIPVEKLPELVVRIKSLIVGGGVAASVEAPAAPPANGPRLGEMLVDSGVATESAVNEALDAQRKPPAVKKIGEILQEANVVSSRKVEAAVEIQRSEHPEKKVGELLVEMGAAAEEEVLKGLEKQQEGPIPERLGESLVKKGEASARDVVNALRAQRGKGQAAGAIKVREAVKVDADRLDQLVDMIGELVIAESMVAQSPDLVSNMSTELSRHVGQLDKITRELQVMAMSLRMVPIKSTFQKMARLVRDLSKKTGKAVDFKMSGEDTELDKTVVDKIGDPLVHMVRNSVDHGIEEDPEVRKQLGKPAAGTVSLRAFHQGGNIHIEIEDDGKGLDRAAILKKALERGIISDGDSLSDREVWNLIFEPGFSTAAKVTEVSGRGVGMDVVKRNIEALRGQTEIVSRSGRGSTFTIRLPLTLAIIDGMVVRIGSERYVLPTLSIVISLRPTEGDINTVVGKGEMLSLHGNLIPLFRLYKLFHLKEAIEEPVEGTVVVVENEGRRLGLLIDEILGQQQIVIKSIGESLKGVPGIAGGAIMPDGRVGLILDINGLVKLADAHVAAPEGIVSK